MPADTISDVLRLYGVAGTAYRDLPRRIRELIAAELEQLDPDELARAAQAVRDGP